MAEQSERSKSALRTAGTRIWLALGATILLWSFLDLPHLGMVIVAIATTATVYATLFKKGDTIRCMSLGIAVTTALVFVAIHVLAIIPELYIIKVFWTWFWGAVIGDSLRDILKGKAEE